MAAPREMAGAAATPGAAVTCTRPSLGLEVAPSIAITVTAPEDGGTITNTATVSGYEVASSLSERDSFSAGQIDGKLIPCLSHSSELIAGGENDGSQVQNG